MKKEQYTETFLHKGLSKAEVEQRRQQYGENVLTPPKRRSLWQLYLEKYQDPIIQILPVPADMPSAENEYQDL